MESGPQIFSSDAMLPLIRSCGGCADCLKEHNFILSHVNEGQDLFYFFLGAQQLQSSFVSVNG